MKAAVIHSFGDPDVLKYEDVPTPRPGAGRILIKVLAAGINRLDHYLREGSIVQALPVPDHVDVIANLACGGIAHLRFSAVTGLAPSNEAWLFGTEGTLRLDTATLELYGGRRRDKELQKIVIPQEELGRWRVEEEFVNAIRGRETVTRTSFEDGVRYMEFTEAVTRSAQSGQSISLPL